MKKKCLICQKPLTLQDKTLELKDFILFVEGTAHEECYKNSKNTGFTCYTLNKNNADLSNIKYNNN